MRRETMVAFHDHGAIMSECYCVATVLTHLPKQYITEGHRQALSMCNIAVVDTRDPEAVYLFTERGDGPSDLEFNGALPPEDAWEEFLDMTGLDACEDEPFVDVLHVAMTASGLGWPNVLQLVLREIPEQVLSHIDVQGSYWADKERPGEFGGFALRITREAVHLHERADQFFSRLDREAKQIAAPSNGSPDRLAVAADGAAGEGGARAG